MILAILQYTGTIILLFPVVVNHSINDISVVDDLAVVLTSAESENIIKSSTENVTTQSTNFTETTIKATTTAGSISVTDATTTKRVTVYHTVVTTPSHSPSLSSDTASSTSCSSNDTNNTPIYVAIVIVIVGVLITIIIVIVGVFLCHRNQQGRLLDKSTRLANAEYKTTTDGGTIVLEVENDLYGKDRLQPKLQ